MCNNFRQMEWYGENGMLQWLLIRKPWGLTSGFNLQVANEQMDTLITEALTMNENFQSKPTPKKPARGILKNADNTICGELEDQNQCMLSVHFLIL